MAFDLVIRNGWIVDGVSSSIYRGTIGIEGDKIAYVCSGNSDLAGRRVIEADEYCVAPGFIDVHTHADNFLLLDPAMKNKLMQGVTTEIGGNCGSSAYPWNESHQFFIPDMEEQFAWDSFSDFLSAAENKGIALNFGSHVGLGSLRHEAATNNGEKSDADSEFSRIMKGLESAMEEGAMGLSMGADSRSQLRDRPDELVELCKVVAEKEGVLSANLYDEGSGILDALTDTVSAAVKGKVALQISHFKTLDRFNWSRQDVALELIETARSKGMNINIDCFPYAFCCSPLGVFLPPNGEPVSGMRAISSFERGAVKDYLKLHFPENEAYGSLICPDLETSQYRGFKGLDILTTAAVLDREPASIVIDLLATEGPSRLLYYQCISDDNMKAAISMDCAMVASDSVPTGAASYFKDSVVHPRTFGAFQQYLSEFVYKNHLLTVPDAIKKITSAPARKFGLKGRGVIGEGGFADITIFDPENFGTRATTDTPRRPPTGVEYVIVNGRLALEQGKFKDVYAGRVLRRGE